MPDFSVTGIVTIDNTQSLLSADEVMTAAQAAARKLEMVRRKALSTLSLVNGLVNQAYTALKQLVTIAGGVVNPLFDALFTMISSIVSTALAGAIMLMATLNPYIIAAGVTLMIISVELNIKAQMDLMESKELIKDFVADMDRSIRRAAVISSGISHAPSGGFGY